MATIANNSGRYWTLVMLVLVISTCQPPEFPKPTITSIEPKDAMPGSTINITGEVLSSVTEVLFGETLATGEFWMNDTIENLMTVLVPQQTPPGNIKVTLKSPQGNSAPFPITIRPLLPKITRIEPLSARIGETVTVIGQNFTSDTKVIFPNGTQVDGGFISGNAMTVKIPEGEISGMVKLSNQLGTSTDDYHYDIIDPASSKPSVSGIDPPEPFVGETIMITGTNFIQDKTTVSLLGRQLSTPGEFSIVSTSEMRVVVPAWATSGTLTIDNTYGSSMTELTIQSIPTVERILPKANGRGGPIIIYGSNLKNVEQIQVGSGKVLKPQFTYIKDNMGRDVLYGSVPAVSAGKTKVKVGNLSGIVSAGVDYVVRPGEVSLPPGFTSITYPNVLVPPTLITMSNSWGRNFGSGRLVLADGSVIGTGLNAIVSPNDGSPLGYFTDNGNQISLRIDTTLYEGRLDSQYGNGNLPYRIVLTPVWSGPQVELIYPCGLDSASPTQIKKGGVTIITGKYFYESDGLEVNFDNTTIEPYDEFSNPDPPYYKRLSALQLEITIPNNAAKGGHQISTLFNTTDKSNSVSITVTN